MKKSILLFVIFGLIIASCKCIKSSQNKNKETISVDIVAKNSFAEDYKIIFNKTGEYALITKSYKEITEPIPNLMYFVYDKNEQKKIIADTLIAGDVYWLNDYAIRATEREQKAESRRRMYTFDVRLNEYILD